MSPDVIAFPMGDAIRKVEEFGLEFEVQKTYSVKSFKGNGKWRIVRQVTREGKLILTAAEESAGIL
jgi:hypothetical protein